MSGEIKILEFFEGVTVLPPIEILPHVVTITAASYTVLENDYYIECDPTSNSVDITMLSPIGNAGRIYAVKAVNLLNPVRVLSADLIDGQTSYIFTTEFESISLISNGSTWRIL